MNWKATKRNYHGEEAAGMIRWVVHREGETRGICECWDAEQAEMVSLALNGTRSAPASTVATAEIIYAAIFREVFRQMGCPKEPGSFADLSENLQRQYQAAADAVNEKVPSVGKRGGPRRVEGLRDTATTLEKK